jgi:hypothetical protein
VIVLQLLGVAIAAVAVVMYALLVIGPALGGVIHGSGFNISPWHALILALALAALVGQLLAYGWWTP